MMVLFKLVVILFSLTQLIVAEAPFYEKHYASKKQALEASFPTGVTFEEIVVTFNKLELQNLSKQVGWKITDANFLLVKVLSEKDDLLGYATILNERGKYHPITFLISVTTDMAIKNVVVMTYREKIGSEVRKKRYLKQYKGKTKNDTLIVDYDIMGISGATISSWTVTSGVKKVLHIIEYLILNRI